MKIKFIYMLTLAFLAFSCESGENVFEDFDTQAVYFPIQYPVRTISLLEDSRVDNSIDLQKSFNIGVAIGGLRENRANRKVSIAVAPDLVKNAFIGSGTTAKAVVLMPSNYYTLASNEIIIPAGSFSGTVKVQLTDAFFADPLATVTTYVIPLVITSSSDNILSGKPVPGMANPDRRIAANWEPGFTPKDFTMFAVKYINKFQGKYLVKGKDETLNATGGVATTDVYNTKFIEQNKLTDLFTLGLTKSTVNALGKFGGSATTKMEITVADNGDVTVSSAVGAYSTTGSGKFIKRGEPGAQVWGGESRKTLILNYTYVAPTNINHRVSDTLVFRNDELKYEDYVISVVK
ncbi:DUF5627 domain-containing protein [Flavobacterium nackdongense]|uniref:DUF1735 domain-containing protein n=1 Tax=Flavobacterium nackdongense TaxID=2547394 RepID=A0A4P6YIR1_9FLAO|nr:DUF5627 domain-containing protein [Flavobacterium nackdongense]QBN20500.1 DUF1735 domain-containing protein [Flavobacterium nackdongense]